MEYLPKDMPEPRGKSVTITAFLYASHALDNRKIISHTRCGIFANRAPIVFYSKRQSTVESSTLSSKFIAMNTCTEHTISLRSKLRMFEVDIYGPAIMLNDNEIAVNNSSKI